MTYYQEKTGEIFSTTAIYPNRVADKSKLESICDLVESGSADFSFKTKTGIVIAKGYLRIVYGDHGPYIEFSKDQIAWDNLECRREGIGYYNEWYPKDDSEVLVYEQRRPVRNLPNPPKGEFSFRGNRKEGYADYQVGRVYVSPYEIVMRKV